MKRIKAIVINLCLPILITVPFLLGVLFLNIDGWKIECWQRVGLSLLIVLAARWWIKEHWLDFFYEYWGRVLVALVILYSTTVVSTCAMHSYEQLNAQLQPPDDTLVNGSAAGRSSDSLPDERTNTKPVGQPGDSNGGLENEGTAVRSGTPVGKYKLPAPSSHMLPTEDKQTERTAKPGESDAGNRQNEQANVRSTVPPDHSSQSLSVKNEQSVGSKTQKSARTATRQAQDKLAVPDGLFSGRFLTTPGTIFALFAASVTILGFTITITRLQESHVRISSYDELLERLSRLLTMTLDSPSREGLRILCTVPTLGNMSRPSPSINEVYEPLKEVIGSNRLDVEIVCIDASLPEGIAWEEIQPDTSKGRRRYNIDDFSTETDRNAKRRRLLRETSVGRFYDKTFSPRGFAEPARLRGMVEAYDIFDHIHKSDGTNKCLFYPWENVTDSPPIHLFWTRKRAIVAVPVDRNVRDQDQGRNVEMIGFETTDRNVIERLLMTYDEWKDYKTAYGLHLMSVATTKDLVDEGRNLVIVALVGTDLHIRIFDGTGAKVDKSEKEFVSGEMLTALKDRLKRFPEGTSLSKEGKQEIIRHVRSIAVHTNKTKG